ncbi:putative domain HDIG-containing protein [Desulfitobacterium dichloroeliminans LMG P-21439]|uniref:Putative domain HDIG-containing protein n=1 Tax=Desulfitobacterium dichloroeliminans (strain LMG P-21439 / DCA1) TaxID=871963 RepID=L0F8J6_DESDL|nr:HD domain-containing protein [Desulfitobacterium dichloroeliminans]AGA69360.1 putative domain HDIG-containing protein [Desulfitobacterium dichloroeliminans LMG P-21439]
MGQHEELIQIINKSGAHHAWGVKHCTRVYLLAKELAEPINLDDEVLYYSALLHDTGRYPAYALANVDHSLRSKGVAANILQRMAFPSHKIPIVLEAIENHMYYSEPGRSDEAVYLRDSDILDNLGNIGLTRLFSLIGQDELIRTPEDAIDRARIFAEALPNKVYTKTGKRLAVKRREEILRFLSGIKKQTSEFAYI